MLLRRDALSLLAILPVLLALAVQVPYCGDYTEANAWNDGEKRMYAKYLSKRQRMEAIDRADIERQAFPEVDFHFLGDWKADASATAMVTGRR